MSFPLHITFHDVPSSSALRAYVEKRASKLRSTSWRILACRVAIESPHRHKQHGRPYRVRIDVSLPGAELVFGRAHDDHRAHEDAYAAIDEAFDAMSRLLHEHVRRRHPSQTAR